ncbi:hypothetical protein BUALT_Bualt16G0109900 [Buddleja alternifolia]|uniref:peptidylprolyl isomerase n=1 Tax=Buddleja alternifolia TaxID=168488 RepID=A0AAV6WLC1_9LAMI|nr:hypothetical protein BUALT_Bualt16G0109900 [Buddleja alternifolia]
MEKEKAISCYKSISLEAELAQVSGLPAETTIGTKGLHKRVLQKGVSWQTPIPGDEVEVHYDVRVQDGEYFDSSREKGTPFRFKLGQNEVIKGWDEGISTMRKGERAIFTIPPELAYGETGSPPLIAPNSTLIFDVELISWYPVRDITGDGRILKKIMKEGDGWATPNYEDEVLGNFEWIYDIVSVKYVAKCENGIDISKSDEGLEFSLASGHLCPAMSKAVKTMRKGEKAEVSVKFSDGLMHCGNATSAIDDIIPPYSNMIIHLELISWRTVVDIRGDKKILKKIMKKVEAFDRPNEGSLIKVIYVSKLEDGTFFETQGSDEEPFEYVCGEEQINEGLDIAIMTMRKGEEAIVKISSDFLNTSEVGDLSYEIKLIDFIKEKPFWKMDAQERIATCEIKKLDGNILFKAGKFQLASKKYPPAQNTPNPTTIPAISTGRCFRHLHNNVSNQTRRVEPNSSEHPDKLPHSKTPARRLPPPLSPDPPPITLIVTPLPQPSTPTSVPDSPPTTTLHKKPCLPPPFYSDPPPATTLYKSRDHQHSLSPQSHHHLQHRGRLPVALPEC